MIVVEGLRKSIRNGPRTVDILKGIDFSVPQGEFVAIMGASGSGKSTLLGLLAGLDTPSAGNVHLNGTAISYLPEDKLAQVRGKTIGFVFQSYQLIPTLTALENVLLPHELNATRRTQRLASRARDLLTSVGLGDRMDHYPVQLSGGEQQRVALARAFVLRPPIVLADEPTGNLDTTNGAHVLELLLNLNRTEGTTLVLVTHDPAACHLCADRRIVLRDGLIVSDELNPNPANWPTVSSSKPPVQALDGQPLLRLRRQDRRPRDALLARQVLLRHPLGRDRSRRAHRRARLSAPSAPRCSCAPAPSWPPTSAARMFQQPTPTEQQGPRPDRADRRRDHARHRAALDGLLARRHWIPPGLAQGRRSPRSIPSTARSISQPAGSLRALGPTPSPSATTSSPPAPARRRPAQPSAASPSASPPSWSTSPTASPVTSPPARACSSRARASTPPACSHPAATPAERYLFKVPAPPTAAHLRHRRRRPQARLEKLLPEAQVTDYRETNPALTQGLDRATSLLSLMSLVASCSARSASPWPCARTCSSGSTPSPS
jgi:putative ABC transport system ATP-binding protein